MAATVFQRSNGSYYVRLFSADQELWLSLRTKDCTVAKLRSAVLHGHLASATLLSGGNFMTTRPLITEYKDSNHDWDRT
jgi:hypothetical protein